MAVVDQMETQRMQDLCQENGSIDLMEHTLLQAVMSAGQVRSRFWDVSDSTGRSCQYVVT